MAKFEDSVERLLVAVAPPTPNGDLHLGHLSGPYLASDVYARYLKLIGKRRHFVTGTDDNQSYVPVKGMKLGKSAQEVVDLYGTSIPATLEKAEMRIDYLLRPTHDANYVKFVQEFFKKMVDSGKLEKRTGPALFCPKCEIYLYEAHVGGKCPKCEDGANGNGCEKCGYVNDCIDLNGPRCNHCKSVPVERTYTRFYFPLSQYGKVLADYLPGVVMNGHLTALTKGFLKDGYPDISVSHVADWGIPVNLPGFEGQVIYEWFEMAAGYLYLTEQVEKTAWEKWWKDPKAALVLCYGFDNAFFYTSFIPAVLKAYDAAIIPPRAFLSNEFYRLEGLKFSTSRNHAIWGDEALATIAPDTLRYHLSFTRPENEQSNFSLDQFMATSREILAVTWEGWLERLQQDAEGKTPATSSSREADRFVARLSHFIDEAGVHYGAESFSLLSATRLMNRIVFEADQFAKRNEFLRGTEEWGPIVFAQLRALQTLAWVAAPILPAFAKRVNDALGDSPPKAGAALGTWTRKEFAQAADAVDVFAENCRYKK